MALCAENHGESVLSLYQCTGFCCRGNQRLRRHVTSLPALSKVKPVMSLKGHQFFFPFDMAPEIEGDKLKGRWLWKTNVET